MKKAVPILYTLEAARVSAGYSTRDAAIILGIEEKRLLEIEASPNPGKIECTLAYRLCKLYKTSVDSICWRPIDEYRGTGVRIVRMEY